VAAIGDGADLTSVIVMFSPSHGNFERKPRDFR